MAPQLHLNLKINNIIYDFLQPMTIYQACLSKKTYLPRFCYHVALKIAGNCRMCLVEEKSSLKPVASCAVSILAGQAIYTNTEVVKRAREGVLEYLLANHPLDCPICDQGGECDLQDQTMVFGADRGRFYENKRTTPNKNLGFLVKTFLNRCIHCARCTRFLQDLAGAPDIQLLGRGHKTEISNYVNAFLTSELSGNIIDLCPVGALTSKPYAFRARPWELFSVYSFDILDGFGASIQLDFRGLELLRILPKANRFLNDEWISDRTRFCYDAFTVQRLITPTFLSHGQYSILNWAQLLILYKNSLLSLGGPADNITFSHGDFLSLESATATAKYAALCGAARADYPELDIAADFRTSFALSGLSQLDVSNTHLESLTLFLLDVNLRFESPVLNLKIRRAFVDHATRIVVIGFLSNFNYEFEHAGPRLSKELINGYLLATHPLFFCSVRNKFVWAHQTVWPNISGLSRAEFALSGCNYGGPHILEISPGQPEFVYTARPNALSLHLYHHMENDSLGCLQAALSLFLPNRFYFEKVAGYFNSAYNFFQTSYPFTYKLPGTKAEPKMLRAMLEVISRRPETTAVTTPSHNSPLSADEPTGEFIEQPLGLFIFVPFRPRGSALNNFYAATAITRLSAVLSLCSARLTKMNDYIYSSIN